MAKEFPQPGQDSKAGPLTFVLVAAILSGVWFAQSPLQTFRHEAEPQELLRENEDVQARLWEDPFLAVSKHEQAEIRKGTDSHDHHSIDSVFTAIQKSPSPQTAPSPLIILINLVNGGPYSESQESRIRHRYAVVSGLGAQGFVPKDSQNIGFFRFPSDADEHSTQAKTESSINAGKGKKNSQKSKPESLVIPYEWYRTHAVASSSHKHNPESKTSTPGSEFVLALWLMDDALDHEQPLSNLGDLIQTLTKIFKEKNFPTSVKIIGPRTSTTLKQMGRELAVIESAELNSLSQQLEGVSFYSPWSTAPESLITADSSPIAISQQFETAFSEKPSEKAFVRTIGTDEQLAKELVQELCRRGVNPGNKEVPIVLVSEWDTAYGRALPLTFSAIVKQLNEGSLKICEPDDGGDDRSRGTSNLRSHISSLERNPDARTNLGIAYYSYLRGLDGELPEEDTSKPSTVSSNNQSAKNFWTKENRVSLDIKKPEGVMQIDYVRRLSARIEEQFANGNASVKAIGILGSDVYDKLLILQALRPRFPHALFFTTDMDTRLLHPTQKHWTRNLLVASHYGLALHDDLQKMVPPFRDSYQTAIFRSVLQALCHDPSSNCSRLSGYNHDEVRLFELGLTRAVDLSSSDGSQIHPDPVPLWSNDWKQVGLLTLLILIGLLILCRFLFSGFLENRTWWALTLFFPIVALFLWMWHDLSAEYEPFLWFEGVSIWPSQLLRVTTAFLCVCFFWRIYESVDKTADAPTGASNQEQKMWNWCKLKVPQTYTDVEQIPRWLRVVFFSTLYFVFALLLFNLLGFPQDGLLYRGQIDSTWQRFFAVTVPLMIAVILFIALIWQVIEHTLECCNFVNRSNVLDADVSNVRNRLFQIADRTERVGGIIYYPIIALTLMAASRISIFDNWGYPLPLVLVMGIHFSLMLSCAVFLRVSAENVRKQALEHLEKHLFRVTREGSSNNIASYELAIADVKNLKHGAFASLSHHPIFGAILYPFGGLGFLVIIEHFIS